MNELQSGQHYECTSTKYSLALDCDMKFEDTFHKTQSGQHYECTSTKYSLALDCDIKFEDTFHKTQSGATVAEW